MSGKGTDKIVFLCCVSLFLNRLKSQHKVNTAPTNSEIETRNKLNTQTHTHAEREPEAGVSGESSWVSSAMPD